MVYPCRKNYPLGTPNRGKILCILIRNFVEEIFFSLKDLNQNQGEVLAGLIKVYAYWIALSDCDGFRIDTVKHVSWEASRNFCGAIHEYAESIGKDNFLLLGEVTGGAAMEHNYLEIFGRNLDAVLDIGNPARLLGDWMKGMRFSHDFFDQFTGHDILGTHRKPGDIMFRCWMTTTWWDVRNSVLPH